MKPEIGITENHLQKSIKSLSTLLADEMVLYIKTRKFHWNVSGASFMELHKLFQGQYAELEETADAVAERISKLGGRAIGTIDEFINLTRLEEAPDKYPSQKEMLKELLDDYETVIVELRKDIEVSDDRAKDAGTTDFLTSIMKQHETTAWVLRRYLS
ncbi:Dps family protein [Flavisolibacter ginsenosidimutans]|uniref:DNA starvation/stationary phase protection protein n=1 Tax=Flavisolibacter ginsenosidimutans TaxID=661481 RepID=A0A5B8UPL7_9BACT|nr:DNA starvation/stationary phase protection protein [Flavisolibacter ginsenosidimutans]QEC57990.1 DNA starvation/stationary phase protection protein [Flavisolibacter ginsenosidimutans]